MHAKACSKGVTVTIQVYNHTLRRFSDAANAPGDTYKLMLCTSATFNAANETLASITKTEVANGNGYTTGGKALTNVAVTTVATSGSRFTADDVLWTASGGPITASKAILFNDTDTDDPPVAMIDFGESKTALDTLDFLVAWSPNGIFRWTLSS